MKFSTTTSTADRRAEKGNGDNGPTDAAGPNASEASGKPGQVSKVTGTERLADGLRAMEGARRSHQSLKSPERAAPAAAFEVVRAERSPSELKRIQRLDGPGRVGDARPPIAGITGAGTVDARVETSSVPAALYLKDLTLNRSFNTFQRTNQVYVTAIAWDLSGRPPRVFPPPELAGSNRGTYAMKPNETVRFIGDGLQLWPQTEVKGGLNLQLVVMESDSDLRKLGDKIEQVREAVDGSDLTAILSTIAAGASGPAVLAAQQAARLLSRAVETILKKNGDDLVATFHGTYGAENIKDDRTDRYDRRGASVTLNLSTPPPADKVPATGKKS